LRSKVDADGELSARCALICATPFDGEKIVARTA